MGSIKSFKAVTSHMIGIVCQETSRCITSKLLGDKYASMIIVVILTSWGEKRFYGRGLEQAASRPHE